MLSLSPAKILVILVIALIVLGPDKLPQVARQMGSLWHDIRSWRSRIESEVRGTFPNLPPTDEVARVVRSPLAFLDRLADEHEKTLTDTEASGTTPAPDSGPSPPDALSSGESVGEGATANGGAPSANGSAPHDNGALHTGNGAGPRRLAPDVDLPMAESGGAGFDDPSMN